jgi:hypothetical protein
MKTIFTAFAIGVFMAFTADAQGTCTRHTEAAGRFSYCPPAGWLSKDSPTSPYKTFAAPQGVTPYGNMNIREEVSTASHNDYVAAALKYLLAGNPGKGVEATKLIAWTDFTTGSNLKGSRFVYETLYQGTPLSTTQFIFDWPGKKIIITFTARETDKVATEPVFDATAKTLKRL